MTIKHIYILVIFAISTQVYAAASGESSLVPRLRQHSRGSRLHSSDGSTSGSDRSIATPPGSPVSRLYSSEGSGSGSPRPGSPRNGPLKIGEPNAPVAQSVHVWVGGSLNAAHRIKGGADATGDMPKICLEIMQKGFKEYFSEHITEHVGIDKLEKLIAATGIAIRINKTTAIKEIYKALVTACQGSDIDACMALARAYDTNAMFVMLQQFNKYISPTQQPISDLTTLMASIYTAKLTKDGREFVRNFFVVSASIRQLIYDTLHLNQTSGASMFGQLYALPSSAAQSS